MTSPSEQIVSRRRAPQKWNEEVCKPNRNGLLPLQSENYRIEFRSCEEGQNDRANTGEKPDA